MPLASVDLVPLVLVVEFVRASGIRSARFS